ncbi:MAG: hypothetical protein ACM3VS_16720 [Candidatus Dadabacteria bacterium]
MKKALIVFFSILYGQFLLAQEKSVDININKNEGGSTWYTSPWVWVIIAAVFILLLVALTRGRRD